MQGGIVGHACQEAKTYCVCFVVLLFACAIHAKHDCVRLFACAAVVCCAGISDSQREGGVEGGCLNKQARWTSRAQTWPRLGQLQVGGRSYRRRSPMCTCQLAGLPAQ